MTLALTLGGWGVAMALALIVGAVLLLRAAKAGRRPDELGAFGWPDGSMNALEAILFFVLACSAPAIVFTVYGVVRWFGGSP